MFIFVLLMCIGVWSSVNAECGVVSREKWDGLEPTHVRYLPRPVDLVIISHTVSKTCTTDITCEESVRGLQTYFMDQLNYRDLGSSFYLGGNGKVYEGPGWLHEGVHTLGYNNRSIAISFIGNYNDDEPTTEMLEAVPSLLKCGVHLGHLSSNYRVVGQKQLIATQSPGRKLYQKLKQWPDWLQDVSSIQN